MSTAGVMNEATALYAERLLFEVPKGGAEDLDKSEISRPILRQAAVKIRDVITGTEQEATRRTYRRRAGVR